MLRVRLNEAKAKEKTMQSGEIMTGKKIKKQRDGDDDGDVFELYTHIGSLRFRFFGSRAHTQPFIFIFIIITIYLFDIVHISLYTQLINMNFFVTL